MLGMFAHPLECCCMMLGAVAQSFKLVKLLSQYLPTFLLFHDHKKHSTTTLNPFVQLFPYCWRPCTCITHGLQSLTGCTLPMMHCRSQHWIWSSCIRLHTTANMDTTTPLCMKLTILDLLQGHNLTMLINLLINTLTWLKSDTILSFVDRTVATKRANYSKIHLYSASSNKVRLLNI